MFTAEGGRLVIGNGRELEGHQLASKLGNAATFVRQDVTQEKDWTGLTFLYAKCSAGAEATRLESAPRLRTRRILGTTSSPKAVIERSTMS